MVERTRFRFGNHAVAGGMHPPILQIIEEIFGQRFFAAIALATHVRDHALLFRPRFSGVVLRR